MIIIKEKSGKLLNFCFINMFWFSSRSMYLVRDKNKLHIKKSLNSNLT